MPANPMKQNALFSSAFAVALSAGLGAAMAADPIVRLNDHTLTDYRAAATPVQDVEPSVLDRGVGIDGRGAAGSAFGWMIAGNPFEPGFGGRSAVGVDLATGNPMVWDVHLALPSDGVRWVVGTSYNAAQESSSSHVDSDGPQGRNWFQISQPEIVLYEHASDDTEDVLYLVYGADRFAEFKRTGATTDLFRGTNGATGVFRRIDGAANEPDEWILTDASGTETTFFGFDADASPAEGQLWKIEDPAGNTAYVGDETTGSTAITDGFDGSGRIEYAYDPADRRYTYAYATVDSTTRLTSVKAETKTGGAWSGTPTGVTEVGKVDYDYYTSSDSHGGSGDLKLVTVTTPLSESGLDDVRETYYRYWKGTFDAGTNPGHDHAIRFIMDPEGTRGFDWADATFDGDYESATDDAIKPYSAAYFEYDSAHRVDTLWRNGECGCSGGTNGEHTIAYETNSSYSDGTGYDQAWWGRAIIGMPDGTYLTQYLDEAGQGLSRVVSNVTPASIDGDQSDVDDDDFWATEVERNSDGLVTTVSTPSNVTAYTHTNGSVAFTNSSSVGRVTAYVRESGSVHTKGFVTGTTVAVGTLGTAYHVSGVKLAADSGTYTFKVAVSDGTNSVDLYRPNLTDRYTYPDETTTQYDATASESTSAGLKPASGGLYPEFQEASDYQVSPGRNGSNTANVTKTAFRADGTRSFVKSPGDKVSFTEYTNGQMTKSIRDADTSLTGAGQDFDGVTVPSGYGSDASGDELHLKTEYTYDAQGRRSTVTRHAGTAEAMTSRTWYTRLADRRLVTLSIPREWDNGGTTTYDGPAMLAVVNHAGQVEFSATVALSGGSSTSALTAWIDDTDDDPITALDVGSLFRVSTNIYDASGHRLDESRVYIDIPASGTGTEGTNYDATLHAYDDMGRRVGTKGPTGTITQQTFDSIGRGLARYVGTNDNDGTTFDAPFESSGTSDMVKVSEVEYDGGNAGGPGLVTKSTAFVQDSTTDQRVTQFKYDGRDQRRVTINPQAPHSVAMLDNMGRVTAAAMYSDTSGVDYDPYDGSAATEITTDASAAKTDRLSLSTTLYDEKGRVYQTHFYPIVQSTGAKGTGSRESNTWYDTEGRVAKVQRTTLEKYAYDRVNRRTHTYVLGDCDDSTYSDALTMSSGDVAVEERQTAYDPDSGLVLMNITIEREHDGYGMGTGSVLDTNADSDGLKLTAANAAYGRAQITAMWYDDLHRLTDTVAYGTYNGATFDRDGLSVPARSATALRTTYAYNDDGTRLSMTDPRDLETRYAYDDAGRQVTVISNYVNGTPSGTTGDDDHHIRYVYTDGLQTKMWVDLDGDNTEDADDQVTVYTYGVTKGASAGDSKIGHGGLLQKVTYPDSSSGTDVVTYAYNAQGQQVYRKDQAGNIIETDYDTAGRETHRRVTTLASGFDGDVRRISTTYEDRGMVALVTSYDNASTGSGSVVNEVSHEYGQWALLETLRQDRDSAVDAGGSVNDYEVSYTFQKASQSCGRNSVGLASQTIAGIRYDFIYDPSGAGGSGSDRPDLNLNRVVAIERYNQLGNTRVAEYDYLGSTHLVRTDYPVPDVFSTVAGATAGTYDGLDRFNRTTSSTWTADLTTDQNFYDVDITYDRNSNITSVEDNVYGEAFSYAYTMDDRNRLTEAERGTWGGSSITTLDENEIWNQLGQTGNWELYQLDLDGNGTFTGTDELDDDRTFNVANELTARDTDDDGSNDFTLTHDAAGNLTDDGEHYEYEYDAFYRLIRVVSRSTSDAVTEYAYNGLGHRVSEINDSDADGSMADETPTWFAYDERWRIVASYEGAADPEEPDEVFVHHRAGLDGRGGSSYIDSVVLRLRDTTGGSPHTLDETVYHCQNWRADVVAIIDESRNQLEQVRYSPYGVPFLLPAGDVVGVWGQANIDDRDEIVDHYVNTTYDVRADLDLDGDVDVDDISAYTAGSGGRGVLSLAGNGNRLGYAGYVGSNSDVPILHKPKVAYSLTLNTDISQYSVENQRILHSVHENNFTSRFGEINTGFTRNGFDDGSYSCPCPPNYQNVPCDDDCERDEIQTRLIMIYVHSSSDGCHPLILSVFRNLLVSIDEISDTCPEYPRGCPNGSVFNGCTRPCKPYPGTSPTCSSSVPTNEPLLRLTLQVGPCTFDASFKHYTRACNIRGWCTGRYCRSRAM